MHSSRHINELQLTDKNAAGCGCGGHQAGGCGCGGHEAGGCACGGHAEHGHAHGHEHAARAHERAAVDLVTTELGVTGMTCGHCVMSITEELGELDGVASVDVKLNPNGVSAVTVTSRSALDLDAARAAVAGAGNYAVVEG